MKSLLKEAIAFTKAIEIKNSWIFFLEFTNVFRLSKDSKICHRKMLHLYNFTVEI